MTTASTGSFTFAVEILIAEVSRISIRVPLGTSAPIAAEAPRTRPRNLTPICFSYYRTIAIHSAFPTSRLPDFQTSRLPDFRPPFIIRSVRPLLYLLLIASLATVSCKKDIQTEDAVKQGI